MLYCAEHRYWATTVGQISCTLHHHGLLAGPVVARRWHTCSFGIDYVH
jgi:hypothetical protein